MGFELWPAAIAGLVGGTLMTVARVLLRASGVRVRIDIPATWGSMAAVHGTGGWLFGLLIHLAGSAALGVPYAWTFDLLGIRDHFVLWGLVGGSIHWLIAGLFMGVLPAIHREIPERQPAPGAFLRNLGEPDVALFIGGHLMYGAVVGVFYGLLASDGRTVFF